MARNAAAAIQAGKPAAVVESQVQHRGAMGLKHRDWRRIGTVGGRSLAVTAIFRRHQAQLSRAVIIGIWPAHVRALDDTEHLIGDGVVIGGADDIGKRRMGAVTAVHGTIQGVSRTPVQRASSSLRMPVA